MGAPPSDALVFFGATEGPEEACQLIGKHGPSLNPRPPESKP
jgi:hypothetical protein